MIQRHWKGIVKHSESENYIEHLKTGTVPVLKKLKGFIDLKILMRETDIGSEFLIVTSWKSLNAINSFAGKDKHKAVVPLKIYKMFVEFEKVVTHYEIVE